MNPAIIQNGCLLYAEPSIIGDICFNRAVILISAFNTEGTVGFILNKPLGFSIDELIPELRENFPVFNGGPVEQDNLYFIHNVPQLISESIEISNGIYWGGNFDSAIKYVNSGLILPHNIRFFLGYSGWAPNQLESECASDSWIVTKNTFQSKLLHVPIEDLWKNQLIMMGAEYAVWSNAPEDPSLN